MSQKLIPLALLSLLAAATGCSKMDVPGDTAPEGISPRSVATSTTGVNRSIIPGRLVVKIKPSALDGIVTGKRGTIELRSVPSSLQSTFNRVGVKSIRPLFPDYPEFKDRRHKAGLDRWMVITYDTDIAPTEARLMMAGEEDAFESVELQYYLEKPAYETYPMTLAEQDLSTQKKSTTGTTFNDPMLRDQWHLHNDASLGASAIAKADINAFDAWAVNTGDPKVVVCIVDGGVDFRHEDIAANFDLSRSYNFMYDKDGKLKGDSGIEIYPDEGGHGTHVAGLVAAVNNNGVGVCGIAGGDGTDDSGVTLINAQVYGLDSERSAGGAAGIVWGADHGAVISQNSWGYKYPGPGSIPRYDKEAIDYFVENAGKDEDGNQLPDSPMKGGVVIFAAGNDGMDYKSYPGAYDGAIAVGAFAWDFRVSFFSNRGDWVDILAPGGDMEHFGRKASILSTVPTAQYPSGYAYMDGTSMACPQVSGVAALILSEFGGKDFTPEMLKERLLHAIRPYDVNVLNPSFVGRLGVGCVDAGRALLADGGKAPRKVEGLSVKPSFISAEVSWNVSADEDALPSAPTATQYLLYLSDDTSLSASDLVKGKSVGKVYGEEKQIGETLSHLLRNLQDGKKYVIGIVAEDEFGNSSAPTVLQFETPKNNAPEAVSGLPEGDLVVPSVLKTEFVLAIKDADGHKWKHELFGDTKGVDALRDNDNIRVIIQPVQKEEGTYTFTLRLTDEFGKTKEYPFSFRFVKYKRPEFVGEMSAMLVGLKGGAVTLPLGDKISYTEAVPVSFEARSSAPSAVSVDIDGQNLVLTPKQTGGATITIVAKDKIGQTATSFKVQVVPDAEATVSLMYPIPAKSTLNLLLHPSVKTADVTITSLRGERLKHISTGVKSDHKVSLDIHDLASGSYILAVETPGRPVFKTTFLKH